MKYPFNLFKIQELNKLMSPTTKYIKHKLTAEEITVIKKALIVFETKELHEERDALLSRLDHKDYFICMYTGIRRKNGKKELPRTSAKIKENDKKQKDLFQV